MKTRLSEMEHTSTLSETLTTMLSTFQKVTASYWSGLFHCYDHADLPRTNNECPTDFTRWRALRSELNQRHEARRMQHRFRKSPESYLAALEDKLSKERLPP